MRRSKRIGASYAPPSRSRRWLIRNGEPQRTARVNQNECTRVTLSAPAAAIGALDVDEAAFLRSHLRSCDRPHPEVG
jgi:hypothetical protein